MNELPDPTIYRGMGKFKSLARRLRCVTNKSHVAKE